MSPENRERLQAFCAGGMVGCLIGIVYILIDVVRHGW
jgi:hypothetical protein